MTASVAKTLHPLPFENLEPKRFEDLVRQLVYDFRPWRAIEATGRSGSDEGFDARAYENISAGVAAEGREEADEDVTGYPPAARVWLIQCKREKSIGPSKIKKHLDAIPPASIAQSYGVLFAAACDFSKATRDACRDWCRHRGIQEVHIWGKAELEDQLYQPKNDNLLFAYFGISLQVRRRSLTTEVRRTTAIKRKIKRHLEEEGAWPGKPFIVRDPTDQRYPYTEGKGLSSGGLLWQPYHSRGIGVNGLRVLKRCHHGYLDHSTGDWDIASGLDRSFPMEAERLWGVRTDKDEEVAQAVIGRWSKLPRPSLSDVRSDTALRRDSGNRRVGRRCLRAPDRLR